MYLGPFNALRAMLNAEFGPHVYTDDNVVCDPNREPQDVGTLVVIADNLIEVAFADGHIKQVQVTGARP